MNVPVAPPRPIGLEALLGGSWQRLRAYPAIVVPLLLPCIVGIPVGVGFFGIAATHPDKTPMDDASVIALLVLMALWFVVGIFAAVGLLATFAMANQLWLRGTTSVGEGYRIAVSRILQAIVLGIGAFGVGIAALILALPTLLLSFVAMTLFLMYSVPAILNGRDGFTAIAESFRLVLRYFGTSGIALLILIAIQYGFSFLVIPVEFVFLFALGIPVSAILASTPPPALHVPAAPIVILLALLVLVLAALYAAYFGFYALVKCGLYQSVRACYEATEQQAAAPLTVVPPVGPEN
jgi:hypothetical protein